MNNSTIDTLAQILNQPYDPEEDLYQTILRSLYSPQGLLVPYQDNLPFNELDNLQNLKVRGNLLKIPVTEQEDPIQGFERVQGDLFLKLQIKSKAVNRELAEIVEGLDISAHDRLSYLTETFVGSLKQNFVKALSLHQRDLVAERLKLWGITIQKPWEFYLIKYDNLPMFPGEFYNLYLLETVLNKFWEPISNHQLWQLSTQEQNYIQQVDQINHHLKLTHQWLAVK